MARPRSNVMMHSSEAYIFFISGFSLFFQRVSSRIPCPKESREAPRLTSPTGRTTAVKKRVTSPGDLVNLSTGKRVRTTSDWTSAATEKVRHGLLRAETRLAPTLDRVQINVIEPSPRDTLSANRLVFLIYRYLTPSYSLTSFFRLNSGSRPRCNACCNFVTRTSRLFERSCFRTPYIPINVRGETGK